MSATQSLLGTAGRWATAGLSLVSGHSLSILIFHRVLPDSDPIFPAEVDAERFDRLMSMVARTFHVLPLAEAVRRLDEGHLPPRALCITFDDGYADNHDIALPILRRHGLSACFFIATGFLGGGRMFNDTVIESVRRATVRRLDLAEFGQGVFDLDTPAQRARAIEAMLPVVKYMGLDERQGALERLRQLCRPSALPDDLMMTPQQVRAMHAAGMEIGAHTVRHPILCKVDEATAARELAESRRVLEELLDHPVRLLAYPNGRPDHDYDHRHAALARKLGFAAAVTTAPGVARRGADLFQLPRFTPWDTAPAPWLARLVACRRHQSFATSAQVQGVAA